MNTRKHYTSKQLRAFKKQFDKLSYTEKLTFWDGHFPLISDGQFTSMNTWFIDDVEDAERNNPGNHISIKPKAKEEEEQYCIWLLTICQTLPDYNFENLKGSYFNTITNNPRAIEFAEEKIKEIKEGVQLERERAEGKAQKQDLRWCGYYWGYRSVLLNKNPIKDISAEDFEYMVESYAKGIVDAHYLGFLEEQLEQLKQKKSKRKTKSFNAPKEQHKYITLAFSYYYKQSVGEIEWFDNWQGGRESAYEKVVSQHYTNPASTAWKQFQRVYVKIETEHSSNRYQHCSKENYTAILELLKDSPKGLAKAKEELSKAIT